VQQHAHYFLDLAERLEPDLLDSRQRDALAELNAEHSNLRLAWERGSGDIGLRIAVCLTRFWNTRGNPHEGRAVLRRTLAQHPDAKPETLAKALLGIGQLAILQNDLVEARPALDNVIALDVPSTTASAYRLLGEAARFEGDLVDAERNFREASRRAEAVGDHRVAAQVRIGQGGVAFALGDHLDAARLWQEAFELSSRIGDEQAMTRALGNLGTARRYLGDFAEAIDAFERSLAIALANGDRSAEAAAVQNIAATMWQRQGTNPDEAVMSQCLTYVRSAVDIYDELGYRRDLANALLAFAVMADLDEGRRAVARARGVFAELGDQTGVGRADDLRDALTAESG
jgi:tetratricopeptide (TPR) repeat protein